MTSVSIVISHYRQPEVLEACLVSLLESPDVLDEIIVSDSGTIDSLQPMITAISSDPRLKVIANTENIGYGRAINAGVEQATSDVIVCINADTRIVASAISTLVATLDDESIGLAGAQLVDADGHPRDSAFRFHRWDTIAARRTPYGKTTRGKAELERFRYDSAHFVGDVVDVDWVVGAAWAMRRTTWDAIGGFDPQFFMYFEDVDLSRRVRMTNKRVVVATKALIRHDEGGASRAATLRQQITNPMTRAHVESAAKYFWKWR